MRHARPITTAPTGKRGSGPLDDLLDHARHLGVNVASRPLGRRRGEYRHAHRLIVLNSRMSTVLQRSTLAHELGHAHYADVAVDDPRTHDMQERRANRYAARLLITPHAYSAAEALVGPHPGALARELGVARYIIDAWTPPTTPSLLRVIA
ncbi:ImmA/IrrE family metallo-endopeptidase [Sanguibacter sp. HDW7]|uniref:ImmA/IrrE family metallo-endopeptidase n=1 Tax=Sanguibacter sp. HDW7 TaxID=2714931 RepID=UPI00140A5074|nr:ImmA/IrrE family metallo-endopeptidase [Sanguibacter sp. HDW7]QIK83022.1 ImmA/IrrE family metallo-endopeptidase [Sanguibacter sp. HDW7]